jgi:hypothetical protein
MARDKESTFCEFVEMIKKSWTWTRLTESERVSCMDAFCFTEEQNILKGNFDQRWRILQAVYNAFLSGIGYQPIGWREKEPEPSF